jgi:hypothetical protein
LDCPLKRGQRDAQARRAVLEEDNEPVMQVMRAYEQDRFIRLMRWIHQWRDREAGRSSGS